MQQAVHPLSAGPCMQPCQMRLWHSHTSADAAAGCQAPPYSCPSQALADEQLLRSHLISMQERRRRTS